MTNVMLSGKPTGPDVAKIEEVHPFKNLKPGDVIKYLDVEKLLTINRNTTRFRTVFRAYRRKAFREANVVFEAVPNVGYVVADNHQRVSASTSLLSGGLRRIGRSAKLAETTDSDGLDEQERRTKDHVSKIGSFFRLHAMTEAQKLKFHVDDQSQQKAA